MEVLGELFHWSPAERRAAIMKEGLVPGSDAVAASGRIAWICLGPTPRTAWSLSGDMEWCHEIDDWDLWQVRLIDTDDVRVRAEYGPRIMEVKVHNAISAERLWWVGTRQPWLTTREGE